MRTTLTASVVALSLLPCAASAQMRPLSDNDMSKVSGQGLFLVSNSSYNGFDFTRISLDADVTLNANLSNLRLGEYTYAPRNGTGADLDIGALQFGRTDGTAAQRLVQITNPYFEFVYKNTGVNNQREVVGMRLGFDGIAGDVGLKIATLSGSMRIDAGAAGIVDSLNDAGGGKHAFVKREVSCALDNKRRRPCRRSHRSFIARPASRLPRACCSQDVRGCPAATPPAWAASATWW